MDRLLFGGDTTAFRGNSPGELREFVIDLPDCLAVNGFPLTRRVIASSKEAAFSLYLQNEVKGERKRNYVRNTVLGCSSSLADRVYEVPRLEGELVSELDANEQRALLAYQFAHDVLGNGSVDDHLIETADRMLNAPYIRGSPRLPLGDSRGDSFFSGRLKREDLALIARGVNPYDEREAADGQVLYRGSVASFFE